MPVHPRTRKLFDSVADIPESIRLIEPLGYLDMAQLVHHSTMIYTDSGGLQKEAYFHGVLCETLRDETEWVETIDAGWNKLWKETKFQERREIADYGNGDASKKIVEVIQQYLGR
jgi:UDP-GlcNAc3NAcA epimerase